MLRKAIVNVADYYLRMAESKTPAEMEAIIWRHDSIDGADHGQSCAAFASLTLELAAAGGGSAELGLRRELLSVAPALLGGRTGQANPASLGIISIQQDAEAQHRWHPLGDGYRPLPGDWVLFDGHVEVVTEDSGGVLRTVGGDSLPNFSVNAHEYRAPLSAAGVVGFVNNGSLPAATGGRAAGRIRSRGRPRRRGRLAAPGRTRPERARADSPPSLGPGRRAAACRGRGKRAAASREPAGRRTVRRPRRGG